MSWFSEVDTFYSWRLEKTIVRSKASGSSRGAGGTNLDGAGRIIALSPALVLATFLTADYRRPMPDVDTLTPADPSDLAAALAFALRYQGRKRVHNADEIMAEIVARRLVEHLARAGFVVMRKPPEIGAAALGRGAEG
jgi:hypothetical protein